MCRDERKQAGLSQEWARIRRLAQGECRRRFNRRNRNIGVEQATRNVSPSFRELAKAAALDPARDFVGASFRDIDFRDEDLRGFDFSNADLTGADFRRANIDGVRFEGAVLSGAIGLPVRPDAVPIYIIGTDDYESGGREFGRFLVAQLKFDLKQSGLSSEVIWVTTSHIQQSDLFHHEILVALGEYGLFIVIVSKEFVSGKRRLEQRIAILKVVDEQRIFLVDMESVAEYKLPAMLRKIKPVQFYEKDRTYAKRGKVLQPSEFQQAVQALASAIRRRLDIVEAKRVPMLP